MNRSARYDSSRRNKARRVMRHKRGRICVSRVPRPSSLEKCSWRRGEPPSRRNRGVPLPILTCPLPADYPESLHLTPEPQAAVQPVPEVVDQAFPALIAGPLRIQLQSHGYSDFLFCHDLTRTQRITRTARVTMVHVKTGRRSEQKSTGLRTILPGNKATQSRRDLTLARRRARIWPW